MSKIRPGEMALNGDFPLVLNKKIIQELQKTNFLTVSRGFEAIRLNRTT